MTQRNMFDNVINDEVWLSDMAEALRKEAKRLDARAQKIRDGEPLDDSERGCANPLCTQWYCSCIACTWC